MCELAAELKSKQVSMHDFLCDLYRQHGYHREALINLVMEGSEGMAAIIRLMKSFRESPPAQLAGIQVVGMRDYASGTITDTRTGKSKPLSGPSGDLVILDLAEEGNYVAVRPSGTEPKIKLYVFTRLSTKESADLDAASASLNRRLEQLELDVRGYAKDHA
jgi:phosphoglucomutase/phosphomannomutase